MHFTFARDRVISSLLGHHIEFKKGVPTYAPPELTAECLEAGGEPSEPVPEADKPVPAPQLADVRADQIGDAIKMLVEANKRGDFMANGAPHVAALTALLGWKPTTDERDTAWLAFQAGV